MAFSFSLYLNLLFFLIILLINGVNCVDISLRRPDPTTCKDESDCLTVMGSVCTLSGVCGCSETYDCLPDGICFEKTCYWSDYCSDDKDCGDGLYCNQIFTDRGICDVLDSDSREIKHENQCEEFNNCYAVGTCKNGECDYLDSPIHIDLPEFPRTLEEVVPVALKRFADSLYAQQKIRLLTEDEKIYYLISKFALGLSKAGTDDPLTDEGAVNFLGRQLGSGCGNTGCPSGMVCKKRCQVANSCDDCGSNTNCLFGGICTSDIYRYCSTPVSGGCKPVPCWSQEFLKEGICIVARESDGSNPRTEYCKIIYDGCTRCNRDTSKCDEWTRSKRKEQERNVVKFILYLCNQSVCKWLRKFDIEKKAMTLFNDFLLPLSCPRFDKECLQCLSRNGC